MWLMLQHERPDDFVIATGETHTLEEFVAAIFESLGLNWHDHVVSDPSLLRPTEIMISRANPAKALQQLGWQAKNKMRDVASMMTKAEIKMREARQ